VQFKPAAVAAHHVYVLSAMARTLSSRATVSCPRILGERRPEVIGHINVSIKHCIILSVRDLHCDVTKCLTHKVAICVTYDVSAPSDVSSNDLMMIVDSVFCFWAYLY